MVDRVRDRGGDAGDPDFAHPPATHRVEAEVRLADPADVDRGDIGLDRHEVAREIRVRGLAVRAVVGELLEERSPDAEYDPPHELAARRLRVEHAPHVEDADHAGDADTADVRIYSSGSNKARTKPRRKLHLKVAIVTGLIAFVIAALFLTVPELIAGESVTGGQRTTVFGGGSGSSSSNSSDEKDEDSGDSSSSSDEQNQNDETTPQDSGQDQTDGTTPSDQGGDTTTTPDQTTPQQPTPQQTTPAPTTPVPTTPAPTTPSTPTP